MVQRYYDAEVKVKIWNYVIIHMLFLFLVNKRWLKQDESMLETYHFL